MSCKPFLLILNEGNFYLRIDNEGENLQFSPSLCYMRVSHIVRLVLQVGLVLFSYAIVQSSISISSSLSKSLTFLVTKVRLLKMAVEPISKSKSSKIFPFVFSRAFSFA